MALMAGCLYKLYYLHELFERIRVHLRLLVPMDVNVHPVSVLQHGLFWLEAFVCTLHLPPFVTFEVGLLNWDNFILYRAETGFAIWNTLRLYRFWMFFVDWQLGQLPRRHTVSSFTGVRLNSAFTFKTVLNSTSAVPFIATLWTSFVALLGNFAAKRICSRCTVIGRLFITIDIISRSAHNDVCGCRILV